jgi:hypothetical protein
MNRRDEMAGAQYVEPTGTASHSAVLPAEIAGVRVPDSELARVVASLVREASPEPLFNHVTRTFVFGSRLGAAKGLKFDPELLFVAAMMHDLGLVERYVADARFEIDGADAAAKILRGRHYPESKIDIVWEAIALHASMEIAERRCPEVALVHLGTFMDAGLDADKLPIGVFQEVFESLPRLGCSKHMIESIGAVLRKKPHTAYLAFEKDIALRAVPSFDPPNFCDLKAPPPFDE